MEDSSGRLSAATAELEKRDEKHRQDTEEIRSISPAYPSPNLTLMLRASLSRHIIIDTTRTASLNALNLPSTSPGSFPHLNRETLGALATMSLLADAWGHEGKEPFSSSLLPSLSPFLTLPVLSSP